MIPQVGRERTRPAALHEAVMLPDSDGDTPYHVADPARGCDTASCLLGRCHSAVASLPPPIAPTTHTSSQGSARSAGESAAGGAA